LDFRYVLPLNILVLSPHCWTSVRCFNRLCVRIRDFGTSTWSIPLVFGMITVLSRSFERYPRDGNPSNGYRDITLLLRFANNPEAKPRIAWLQPCMCLRMYGGPSPDVLPTQNVLYSRSTTLESPSSFPSLLDFRYVLPLNILVLSPHCWTSVRCFNKSICTHTCRLSLSQTDFWRPTGKYPVQAPIVRACALPPGTNTFTHTFPNLTPLSA